MCALKKVPMNHNSSMKVTPLVLGSASFGDTIPKEDAFRLMDAYVDAGGNMIDTANVYGDWLPNQKSPSEKIIGEWCKARGNRQDILLATKGAHPPIENLKVSRLAKADILHDIEQSLNHLQTDVIDLYWLHRDDPNRPVAEIIETLQAEVQRGRIRAYGCSNWRLPRIQEANAYAAAQGMDGFVANQLMFSLARINEEALFDPTMVLMDESNKRYLEQENLAAFAYSSQANGFFSGQYQISKPLPNRKSAELVQKHYFNEINFARLKVVERIAEAQGLLPQQVALRYVLSQPFNVYALVGCRTVDQLHESIVAAEQRLSPLDVIALEQAR